MNPLHLQVLLAHDEPKGTSGATPAFSKYICKSIYGISMYTVGMPR